MESIMPNNSNLINLTIVLRYENFEDQVLDLTIHKSRDLQDVRERTTNWLCEKFNFMPQEG